MTTTLIPSTSSLPLRRLRRQQRPPDRYYRSFSSSKSKSSSRRRRGGGTRSVSAIIDDFDDDDDGAVFRKTIFFASSLSSTLSSRRRRRRRELLVVVPSKKNARRTTTSAKKTDEDEKTEEATTSKSSSDDKIDGNEPSKMKKEDEKSGSGGASTNDNSWTSANQRRQEQQQSHSPRSPSSPPPNRSVMLVNRATKIVATYALVSFLAYAYEAAFGTSDGNPYAAKERRARVLQVSYSKFLRDARRNEIGTVTVAGDRLTWKPRKPTVIDAGGDGRKSGNEGKRGQERRGGETTTTLSKSDGSKSFEIHYATRKPADAQTPYAQLEKNDVELFSVDADGDKNAFDFPFLVFASIVLFFWLRNIRENSMMMGSGGGMPGGRGGMPGGGMPGGIPGAGRQVGGRSFNGRGRNDPNFTPPPSTTFEDVAGVDEAKEELSEIVDILKNPERYSKLGARPPCGVLLCGSPGTGKTLLARAVAGEAGVPFISVAASEFVELYVGMGASRVRDVFARARAQAPAIVFIDEIDAVAKGRSDGKMRGMGNDEREQTLNQLLTELDGFDADASRLVICIGATNRPDTLDAALRRPGRFDRIVQVDKPDVQGRREILDVHVQTRGLPLENNVQQNDEKKHLLDEIATMTSGFTGADLENLVNEAALLAGRENKTTVGKEEFEKAVLRTVAGVEKKRSLLGPREKFNVSAHEVGHAIVSQAVGTLLPGSTKPEQISIVARSGGALGFTYTPPNTDEPERKLMFADELRGQIATFMGGRAAEMIACKRVSTGASDDIQRATMLAYKGFAEWGLSASVGPISIPTLSSGGNPEDWSFSDRAKESGHDVEGEVTGLLNAALVVACETLQLNEALLREASEVLAKEERVQGDALRAYLDRAKAPASLAKFLEGKYDIPTREDFRRLNAMPLPEFEVARALSSDNSNHNNNNSVDGGDNNSSNNSSNDTNKVAPR